MAPGSSEDIGRLPKKKQMALFCASYNQCCDTEACTHSDAGDQQGSRQYACPVESCGKCFKQAGHLKGHLADVHGIGVTWHPCTQEGCKERFKRACHLKQHLADVHGIGVTWHPCTLEGCKQRFKNASNLKQHLANVHDIGVTWHPCTQEGCKERFKHAGHLKKHWADVHDIDVTWHPCTQEGCKERFKHAGNLKRHLADVHDIGPYTCGYCCCNRTSRIPYDDLNVGYVHICRKCFRTVTGKNSRVELLWSHYVDTELGTEGLRHGRLAGQRRLSPLAWWMFTSLP
jgi:uncharacterized Zn-finger protein